MNLLKIPVAILLACALSVLVVFGMPWTYIAGFFVALLFSIFFFAKPLPFLAGLIFLRAGVDSFLVNVRFADLGLAGGFSLVLVMLTMITILLERNPETLRRLGHPLIK